MPDSPPPREWLDMRRGVSSGLSSSRRNVDRHHVPITRRRPDAAAVTDDDTAEDTDRRRVLAVPMCPRCPRCESRESPDTHAPAQHHNRGVGEDVVSVRPPPRGLARLRAFTCTRAQLLLDHELTHVGNVAVQRAEPPFTVLYLARALISEPSSSSVTLTGIQDRRAMSACRRARRPQTARPSPRVW
jgi:hypothetical protein